MSPLATLLVQRGRLSETKPSGDVVPRGGPE